MHASGYHESNVCVAGGACSPPFSPSNHRPRGKTTSVIARVVCCDRHVASGFAVPGRHPRSANRNSQ
jgi:hypothetical protein